MTIVVLGAGALGSILTAHLTRAGENVRLIARGTRARLIQDHGITVTGLVNCTVPVSVTTCPHEVREADVLIVAVKTYDTESALESVSHLKVNSVLSVQNGVLKNEQLAQIFGWEKTLGATAMLSGEVISGGTVRFTLNEALYLGELPDGISGRVEALAAALARAGIGVEVLQRVRTAEWSKYVFLLGSLTLAVLTRLETYKIFKDPDLARMCVILEREAALLAAKLGIPLEDYGIVRAKTHSSVSLAEAVTDLQHIGEQMEAQGATTHKISALQDLEHGRRLEVEEILGYAVRKGTELGVPLPTVNTCYRLVTGIDRYLRRP